jgi:hypothetical protein
MGNYLGSGGGGNGIKPAWVPQTKFDQAKTKIQEAFTM